MKEGWTYKKLGEVGTVIGGSTPKTDNPEFWDGDLAWITPAELDGSKYVCSTVRTITEKAVEKTNLTLLPIGTVLLSSRAPIGKVCITKIPMYCNQGFKNIVCSDELNNEYLYWWLKGKNEYLNTLGVGATFKEISKRIVEQITIPVPPIETQNHIVSELDILQSIIDKQQAQLKELDNLAQAIFYDMFGDPIENEKGWEVKPFSTMCSSMTKGPFGSDIKKDLFVPKSDDTYKVYIQINAIQKDETLGDYYITKDYFEDKMSRFEVKPYDYIITCDGTLGKHIRLTESMERGIISASLLRVRLNDTVSYCYFEALWDNYVLDRMKSQARNAALIHLPSAKVIGNELVPIPPIALQQSFTAKIESIEKQKSSIGKSIEETQKLFDYTMDKYFG